MLLSMIAVTDPKTQMTDTEATIAVPKSILTPPSHRFKFPNNRRLVDDTIHLIYRTQIHLTLVYHMFLYFE